MLGRLIILAYHGVTKAQSFGIENYHSKHICESAFAEQLSFMSRHCNVLSMDEVVHHYHEQIPFPPNAVAITFDDGFENNYSVAAPMLSDYHLKAAFYITAGIVDSEKMFWVDQLEDCLNLSENASIQIQLEKKYVFDLDSHMQKIIALEHIKSYCKNVSIAEKDRIVHDVIRQTNVSPEVEHAENYRKITSVQLKEMSESELFIIGGHSYAHNILSKFEKDAELEKDISLSIDSLNKILGKSVRHYAYPEGQPQHYNQKVIDMLKTRNIICCPSAVHGENNGNEDLFNLKRIMVGFKGTPFPFFPERILSANPS